MLRHHRTVLSQPAVESLRYWGITDYGAWLGAPSGLVRRDGTRKPSYDALDDLIPGEWWLAETVRPADEQGAVAVRGFASTHRVLASRAETEIDLAPGQTGAVVVELTAPRRNHCGKLHRIVLGGSKVPGAL